MAIPTETIRSQFIPKEFRIIFVGESPPAGGTFFYSGNSILYRYTREAFSKAFDIRFRDSVDFLHFFQHMGCYLDDLCLTPVNDMPPTERRAACRAGIQSLACRLNNMQPMVIISVSKAIAQYVCKSAQHAELGNTLMYHLPFPAMSHQQRYVSELSTLLDSLKRKRLVEY